MRKISVTRDGCFGVREYILASPFICVCLLFVFVFFPSCSLSSLLFLLLFMKIDAFSWVSFFFSVLDPECVSTFSLRLKSAIRVNKAHGEGERVVFSKLKRSERLNGPRYRSLICIFPRGHFRDGLGEISAANIFALHGRRTSEFSTSMRGGTRQGK